MNICSRSAIPNLFSGADHQFHRKSLRPTNSYICIIYIYNNNTSVITIYLLKIIVHKKKKKKIH
jgi:hypothetical protein